MKWAHVLTIIMFVLSCGKADKQSIGIRLVNPYSVASAQIGTEKLVFALSSAGIEDYKTGNILSYSLGSDGKSSLKGAIEVPVFGTQIAADAELKYLVAGFVGNNAQIMLFDIQTGLPVLLSSVSIGAANSIGLPIIFSNGAEKFVALSINPNQFGGIVQLWNISTPSQPRLVLSLPKDLSTVAEPNVFGYSSPAYVSSEGLFVAFPSNAATSANGFPVSAEGFLAGLWDKKAGDARAFSAVVFDMNKLTAGSPAREAFVYVPLLAATNGFSGSTTTPEQRATVIFRTHISTAVTPVSTNCKQTLNTASVIVSDEISGNVFRIGGWGKIKAQWASSFAELVWTNKLAMGSISFEMLASSADGVSLSSFPNTLLSLILVDTGSQCFPAWLRVESRASGEAVSRSWLQWNPLFVEGKADSAHNLKQVELFARGVVGASASGEVVSAVSFSSSSLLGLKYNSVSKSFDAL